MSRPRRRLLAAALFAMLLAGPLRADDAPSTPVRLRHPDGLEEELATESWDGVEYLAASDACRIVAATKQWHSETVRLVLHVQERDVRMTLGSGVALLADKPVVMSGPLRVREGVFWLPLDFFAERVAPLAAVPVAWVAAARQFVLEGGGANVRGVSLEPNATGALLRIALATYLPHRASLDANGDLLVAFRGGVLPPDSLVVAGNDDGLVTSVVREPRPDGASLRVRFSRALSAVRSEYDARSRSVRVVIAFGETGETAPPDAGREDSGERSEGRVGGESPRDDDEDGAESATKRSITTVVLDPGHGGGDDGVVGAGGVREKDVTLSIALAARPLIEQRLGLRVVLTRDVDAPLTAEERAQLANGQSDALYVSIHCGAWSDPSAAGFETAYFGAPAPAAGDLSRAAGRPVWVRTADGRPREVRFVPWQAAPARFAEISGELAQTVSAEMERALPVHARGVRRGRIGTLSGVKSPAILIEVGLLTNTDEEARLGSANFLGQVADAIEKGLGEFLGRQASIEPPVGRSGSRTEVGLRAAPPEPTVSVEVERTPPRASERGDS